MFTTSMQEFFYTFQTNAFVGAYVVHLNFCYILGTAVQILLGIDIVYLLNWYMVDGLVCLPVMIMDTKCMVTEGTAAGFLAVVNDVQHLSVMQLTSG